MINKRIERSIKEIQRAANDFADSIESVLDYYRGSSSMTKKTITSKKAKPTSKKAKPTSKKAKGKRRKR